MVSKHSTTLEKVMFNGMLEVILHGSTKKHRREEFS